MNALKLKKSDVPVLINKFFSSVIFPVVTAAITLICYYLGWDLITIYYIVGCLVLICVFCDDLTPAICAFLFMGIMVSMQNSPSFKASESDFYNRPYVIAQIAVLIVLMVGAAIYRITMTAVRKKFKLTPVFFSFCVLSVILLFNGLFSKEYAIRNVGYGAALAFMFLGVFALLKDNIPAKEETFKKIFGYFMVFSAALLIEMIVVYLTRDVITSGGYDRNKIVFGWGIHNTMGMYLLICVPPVMYAACRHKRGYLFFIYSMVLTLAAILTFSRQAMMGAAIIFPICYIIMIIKGKNRKINLIITGVAVALGVIAAIILWDKIFPELKKMISALFNDDGSFNGNQRVNIWKQAIEEFQKSPVFGTGFYTVVKADEGVAGLSFIPSMYHNTFMELLGACGILALIAYLVHRVTTVLSFVKNINMERAFAGLTVFILLVLSLVDNHLFYLFPTAVYSSLIALLVRTEKKQPTAEPTAETTEAQPPETQTDAGQLPEEN